MKDRLPFAVDRHDPRSLIDQIVGGIKRCVELGHFEAGATLPTLKEMATDLDVSLDVVRAAVRNLTKAGILTARPKCGIHVCTTDCRRWHSHVLYLHWGGANSFYEAVAEETLLQELREHRILMTPAFVDGKEIAAGCSGIRSALRASPINLAVVVGGAQHLDVLLAEFDVPFVQVTDAQPSPFARRVVLRDPTPALKQVVAHTLACGGRSLMILAPDISLEAHLLQAQAESAGLSAEIVTAPPAPHVGRPEGVERGGLEGMAKLLASGAPLPDLFFFADDYLARGALMALLARGIRIPEQVQVITHANRNLGPVFLKTLTRVEMDPERDSRVLESVILETLRAPHKKVKTPVTTSLSFITGETTRKKARVLGHAKRTHKEETRL